ncbi:MAG: hypothetical protein HYV09_08865 [Deltaproteobacteria bacterium]|nr:hypothetical protein [Deltaproteobacteria bacterium]
MSLLLAGCGTRVVIQPDQGDGGAVVADTGAPETAAPGAVGAPCKGDGDCTSKFCLSNGRCSKGCEVAGSCPKSWACVVVPGRGPMCDCDIRSTSEVACNAVDDDCNGLVDEGSPTCGGVCVDTNTDPKNCGGCAKACPGAGAPNAEPQCAGGACKLKCAAGFGDCDSNPANGCEADLASREHCGSCAYACKTGETCSAGMCTTVVPVDVTVLLGVTGSTQPMLNAALPALKDNLVTPLLALPGVAVGVSYTCEFPNSPYGSTGDRPFQGGVEPTTDASKLFASIDGYPKMGGGDASDGMIEALGTLSGRPVHPASQPLTCSAGRAAGGCWRAATRRVIVLFTDDTFHNGPLLLGPGLYAPYAGITPAPQDWPAVLGAMKANGMVLLVMNATTMGGDAYGQYKRMITELGQPATDIYPSATAAEATSAADAIVARVKALRGG